MWMAPEDRDPVPLHAPPRKAVACFAVFNLRTGLFIRHTCAVFNAQTFRSYRKRLLRCR